MPVMIASALALAGARGYGLKRFFAAKYLGFVIAAEVMVLACNISVLAGSPALIPYARAVHAAYLIAWLPVALFHRLHKPLLAASGMLLCGSALNSLAIGLNGGFMPVYPSLSTVTGYANGGRLFADGLHVIATAESRAWFLCDFIDTGIGILSVGDVLMHAWAAILAYSLAKTVAAKENANRL